MQLGWLLAMMQFISISIPSLIAAASYSVSNRINFTSNEVFEIGICIDPLCWRKLQDLTMRDEVCVMLVIFCMCSALKQKLYCILFSLPMWSTKIMVTYNLLLKILNGSSAFSGLGIIVNNVLLCRYKISHAFWTFLCDTEVSQTV